MAESKTSQLVALQGAGVYLVAHGLVSPAQTIEIRKAVL